MRRPSLTKKIAESLDVAVGHLLRGHANAAPADRPHLARATKFLEDLLAHKRSEDQGDGDRDR